MENLPIHYLSFVQKLVFSIGHIFNDLSAAFWFTYLLIFMHSVNGFNSNTSGILMLIGQIADGIATPFVGIECDRKLNWWICNYGRRKCWHFIGTILVFLSFPFLFNRCITCENASEKAQIVYYSAFIIMFQFGWASVQISHLSLIPALTPISSERVELNAYRYAFTVFANITVYVMMWLILSNNTNDNSLTTQIGPQDAVTFRKVAFIIIGLGLLFSILFHIGVREKSENSGDIDDGHHVTSSSNSDLIEPNQRPIIWTSWFNQSQFYKVALLYMGTRLTINLTQVYIPNYLQETLFLQKKSVAYIPLVTYTSGFLSSFLMKFVNSKLGKKITFFLGSLLSLTACTWIYFGTDYNFKYYGIFAVSIIIGTSNSIMLITSLAITNDLIGRNTASGAFVFGAMSFVDKVSNGIAVWIIEYFKPCSTYSCLICDYYYRDILTFVCGGATSISILSLALMSTMKIGHLKRSNENSPMASITDLRLTLQDEERSLLTPLLDDI